ncbi:DNA-formamidopyrimidine glycosylase [Candidatus Neomarinimicrobiota bacterium]
MPELPEVETVVRYLRPKLKNQQIVGFNAYWPKVTAPTTPEVFSTAIVGRSIRAVIRRGKYIILNLDKGFVHLHLRMTGNLSVVTRRIENSDPHITAEFQMGAATWLIFRDTRKFGRIGYLDNLALLEAKLGPDPLSEEFTPQRFHSELKNRHRRIKPLLLDQSFIAGLGNIYVDEALFLSRIHPESPASTLSYREVEVLHSNIRNVLLSSIENSGTTLVNFRFGATGLGRFREMLQVFRREGTPCPICGKDLIKIRVAQRGTHICPHCQKKKRKKRK